MLRKLSMLLLVLSLFALSCSETSRPPADSAMAKGTKGMVSTAHPVATEAGLKILQAGGNAFDAAVAIATTLNVVEPMMSGIGGYGTILIYDAEKKQTRFLDSSGKIPMSVDSDVFRAPTPNYQENRRGPKAVSTPGNVNAWDAMSREYGRLEWKQLFETAVATAEDGFVITARIAGQIERAFDTFPEHAKVFYGKNGKPLQEGDRLIQRELAKSLRMIAEQGLEVFYGGELGRTVHAEMQSQGSFLSIDDLIADEAEWWEPISIAYKNYDVFTASPPATAFPSLIRLGFMSRFDGENLEHNSAEYLHLFAEATKQAFWCRLKYAGDPDHDPPPLDMLLSANYWEQETAKFNLEAASKFTPPGHAALAGKNTTHFVVADQWGNIVSATQTLGNLFGSRLMPEGTGIWLNNSLAYCTFEPKGNPMDAHAGHRKLSGDCPTIIFKDGKPWAALGTPGGHTIGQTVPQMVMNLIDFGMDVRQAISAPRVSFIEPNFLAVEELIPDSVVKKLTALGHNVIRTRALGRAHALTILYGENGNFLEYQGASDPRGEGAASGFE